ncbi:hypothetical protein VSS37_03685 [Candidatus Thiothrix sp. Deng01]|uniref:DNA transfer protein n=1 Tax=Candidatus Thiothrix phosphatis TaxID=3112415 RepID=A0ABU6CU81_9GAMM|nr:hypothetical protein [Candidatus Thiothrix sp. Deng01]MEB4590072.1 hypothetical protein [Candidatus Thiothrix sp. Deng01]
MGLFSAIGGLVGSAFGMPGVGAAVGGLVDGAQSTAQANKASAQQDAMLAAQARLYNQQADMGQHFFDQYTANYEPLALSQLQAARAGVDPNYYASVADAGVVRNQALALGSAQRNLERAGVSPADGRWLAMQGQDALALSGSRVAAQNQARQQALDMNWNRRNQQVDYGAGLVNRGSGMMSGAAAGMAGVGNSYGQQAQAAGQTAGSELFWAGIPGGMQGYAQNLVQQYRNPSPMPNTSVFGNLLSFGSGGNGGFGGGGGNNFGAMFGV